MRAVTTASMSEGQVQLWLDAVIMAVTADRPRVLTVLRGADGRPPAEALADSEREPAAPPLHGPLDALPFGPLDVAGDRTLEGGLRRHVRQQTGLELGYVEQLYTFGDALRDPAQADGGPRVVSAAYLALVREERPVAGDARWRDVYAFLPWEDHRVGRPSILDERIAPAATAWAAGAQGVGAPRPRDARGDAMAEHGERRERADIAFGFGTARWDDERVLARYELLYELALVAERARDDGAPAPPMDPPRAESLAEPGRGRKDDADAGRAMALDHRRILATALGRVRAKIKYRPLVFELVPPEFTLRTLQHTVEALAGMRLHTPNFRRLVDRGGLVEGTGHFEQATGGRPAERFRFRREVLRERRAPGVGLPTSGSARRPN